MQHKTKGRDTKPQWTALLEAFSTMSLGSASTAKASQLPEYQLQITGVLLHALNQKRRNEIITINIKLIRLL